MNTLKNSQVPHTSMSFEDLLQYCIVQDAKYRALVEEVIKLTDELNNVYEEIQELRNAI